MSLEHNREFVWRAQEGPQSLLLSCPAKEIMFGGARGGGKSDCVIGEWAAHAAMYGEHASGLMVRRSRTELAEMIERAKTVYTPLGARFNEQKSMFRFPNGARLRFGYLERDSDADQFQGWSLTRLYVEEVGTFPNERVINKLMATLRSGHGVPVKFVATGNPGGAGQGWVKARWIDPCPEGNKLMKRTFINPFTNEEVSWRWTFIPSKVTDNAYLDSSYIAQLSQVGSPQLVKAWLEGDWNAVEGAFFAEWDERKHVVPAELIDLEKIDALWFRSIDVGFAAPFSVGWWAHLKEEYVVEGDAMDGRGFRGVLKEGCLLRVQEWYGAARANIGLRLPSNQVAKGILARDPLPFDKWAYTVIDPSAFKEEGGPSIAERMGNEGLICRPADNKRLGQLGKFGGWDVLRQRLQGDAAGNPMVMCVNTCVDSIRTIPTIQHDPDKLEDLDTESEDHAADEWRYAVMSRPWFPREFKGVESHKFKDYGDKHREGSDTDFWVTL